MKNKSELIEHIKDIVKSAKCLSDCHTGEHNANINYACIFSQSAEEFSNLIELSSEIGEIIHNTKSGPVFKINQIDTVAGLLKILKIRKFDPTRPQYGDADFTIKEFDNFKNKVLTKKGFKLIERPEMEMVELADSFSNVLVYYSNPTLAEVIGVKI